jgi:hypothetical protein
VDVFHYNRARAHFRSYAAELILSAFGAVEIPKAYDHSPDIAEAIKREAQAPLGVIAYCIGDTEVLGTNLYWHIYSSKWTRP